jgi:hypothetical protein
MDLPFIFSDCRYAHERLGLLVVAKLNAVWFVGKVAGFNIYDS